MQRYYKLHANLQDTDKEHVVKDSKPEGSSGFKRNWNK